MIEIYDKENINEIKKSLTNNQEAFFNYFEPIMQSGINCFIKNINCEIKILKINDLLIPLVFTDRNYDDCLYTSLLSHYIKYISEEFDKKNSKFNFILKFIEKYLIKNEINKTIYVNQWFISTNLYPALTKDDIQEITDFLKINYKNYAIVFKNIIKEYDTNLYENLNRQGYKEIISRQIFINDKKMTKNSKQRAKVKKDFKFYINSNYKAYKVQNNDDYTRIKDIYTMLYIKKYSKYNPLYTEEYFKLTAFNPIFNLTVFKNKNIIDSMCLTLANSNVMTAPAVGYDLTMSKDLGLYRIISAYIGELYNKNYAIFNMSAGIGEFKMQRGAKPYFEYLMIYYNHLPANKRIMFYILKSFVNKIIPILCKYKLCGFVRL